MVVIIFKRPRSLLPFFIQIFLNRMQSYLKNQKLAEASLKMAGISIFRPCKNG